MLTTTPSFREKDIALYFKIPSENFMHNSEPKHRDKIGNRCTLQKSRKSITTSKLDHEFMKRADLLKIHDEECLERHVVALTRILPPCQPAARVDGNLERLKRLGSAHVGRPPSKQA